MGNSCPCHGCVTPKRYPGCHDKCKAYRDWKASEQVKNDAERKRKEEESAIFASYKPKRR